MTEKDVEGYLVKKVKAAGGKAYKWVSPGNAGVPDRIVLMPGGTMAFVELKRPGGQARALQKAKIRELLSLGFTACLVDSKAEADALVCYLAERGRRQYAVYPAQVSDVLCPADT